MSTSIEIVSTFLVEYVLFFVGLLLVAYILPAGTFYWFFYVKRNDKTEAMRIQRRRHTAKDLRREVKDSITCLLLFALYSTLLYEYHKQGNTTSFYFDVNEYPLYFMAVGFIVFAIIHDAYFYWVHRLMHWKPLFRYIHLGHHKSRTPTPWSMLAFQPLETIFQFGIFALAIIFLPLHPATLIAYVLINVFVNAAGHAGHEFVPEDQKDNWLLKFATLPSHHDLHHSKINFNYGQYFTVWDRLMGTFLDQENSDRKVYSKSQSALECIPSNQSGSNDALS